MNRSIILPLTLLAFVTATAFHLLTSSSADQKTVIQNTTGFEKRFAFRCSPAYIPSADEDIPLLTGWSNYKWKISTHSDSAQAYFNQGMAMYYAFHIIESRASFDKATRFDPSCAMAWWGKALAFGPNINDFGYQRPSEAYPSAVNAVRLQKACTPLEKTLINAIAIRYSDDLTVDQKRLNENYRDAMSSVARQFASNADVIALYADALMLLHPWDLYNHDYSPKAWTPQILSTIKQALRLSPSHIGANHYYIHAVEASAHPGDALKSAKLLATAMPNVSHITHMPSHIYIRTGYYNAGITVNNQAADGFQKYLLAFAPTAEGAPLYSLHNLHMKMACAQMAGSYKEAIKAANDLQRAIPEAYLSLPGAMGNAIQYWHQSPLFTYVRFGKWSEILSNTIIDSLPFVSVLQHFARGLAYARTGHSTEAAAELSFMQVKMQTASLKEPAVPFNSAYDASLVAETILEGVLAEQQGQSSLAIQHFEDAVKAEDNLIYNEPRDWLLPARQYLGNALLTAGEYSKAVAVLQQDLAINPSNGWALTGLQTAYEKLNRSSEMLTAKQRLKAAWLIKDVKIKRPVF